MSIQVAEPHSLSSIKQDGGNRAEELKWGRKPTVLYTVAPHTRVMTISYRNRKYRIIENGLYYTGEEQV